ncbi:hypothetical protein Tco_1086490 [Tanacetum coccineum]
MHGSSEAMIGNKTSKTSSAVNKNEVNALKENANSLIEPENNNAFSKSEIETQMQRQEEKVDMREAVDARLVVTESSGKKPDKQDTSSSSGNYTTQASMKSKPNYDTHLLETIDSNTTPTSTNMCHRGGEIDQDALLNAELLKTKDMEFKEFKSDEHASKDVWTKQFRPHLERKPSLKDLKVAEDLIFPISVDVSSTLNLLGSLLHDNIVLKQDLALELGKSISLTEAEEEAVAREVHATHARIVS